ncbi:MAG: GAF domain-containing protein [Bacteroidales bacterium]|nr:GAF domain-containing protein [Bacteroidales bacterium]
MKINAKMLVYILSTSMLIFIASIGYLTTKSRHLALEEALEVANKNAHEYANLIKSELASDFNIAKTIAQTGQAFQSLPREEWNKIFLEQQLHIITENPHYLAVATSWELNHIDPEWTKPFGRYLNGWVRDQHGNINQIETQLNTDGDVLTGNYYAMKSTGISMIVDPTLWSPTGRVEDQYINTNISVPIKLGNTFIGLAGIDVDLQRFQDIIETIKPFEESYAFLLSHDGTYVAHPNSNLMGKLIADEYPEFNENFQIVENVQAGVNFFFTYKNENNQKNFYVFAPIKVENVNTPWSLAIVVPNKVITSKAKTILYKALLVSFFGLLLLTIVIWVIAKNITNPVIRVTETLKNMAKGKISESLIMEVKTKDEVGEMTQALNTSINELNKKAEFANQIGSGNIDYTLDLISEEDELGQSLINMRNSLLKARSEEEKRKEEDKKRRWTNEGLAIFAEILRNNTDNLNVLAKEIIKNLVYYLNANQGGLFVLNDQEKKTVVFDLLSAFAFDSEKFIKKQIELGEGLVGTCAVEKQTLYLTEIPQDYIHITSGLGGANPNSLLFVPLKIENTILGVIEIASFNKFKKHEIEFAEKAAESIASALKSVGINARTTLLLEQSQQQAEEMAAQEEEMRQNMEELQATQEESSRKSEEFSGIINGIDHFILKAEFNLNATLIDANDLFLRKFQYKINEATGMEIEEFVAKKDVARFQKILNEVMEGKTHQEVAYLKNKNGDKLKLITSFAPVFINENFEKILFLGIDINQYK